MNDRFEPDDSADGPADGAAGEGDEEFVPTGKWASPAIYARNWKSILIIDSMLGVAVFWIGFLMILFWNWFVGSFIGALGLTYIVAVGRRYLQWRWLRQQAGMDT